MLDDVMIFYLLVVCIVSSVTDWKQGKIYNKWLSLGMLFGIVMVIYYYMIHKESLYLFITNMFAAFIIAVIFFSLKLWGAGDSKLWLFVNFMYPTEWYLTTQNMFSPSMILFMITFIEAYIFVFVESLWLKLVRRENGLSFEKFKADKETIWNVLFAISFLSVIFSVCGFFMEGYFESNRIFFSVVGVLLTNKLVSMSFSWKKQCTLLFLVLYVVIGFAMTSGFNIRLFVLSLLLVTVTNFSLRFANKYNYKWINTSDVKAGMILSFFTVQQFYGSRVKGLPMVTDETTKSRISEEEAEAVKRWGRSKYGKEQIMIVRHIPFAIFILMGLLTYIMGVYKIK